MQRFMQIKKDGSLELRGDPRIVYQIMVATRLMLIEKTGVSLHRFLLIATRYAACRRQFATISGTKVERKLLDYQTHLHLIGQQTANSFILNNLSGFLNNLMKESNELVKDDNFKLLDILHHLSSGIKAISIEMVYKGVDELRQSCGGAGFLMSSGICEGWCDYSPLSTLEGVNVLMAQQSARYLFKQYKKHE